MQELLTGYYNTNCKNCVQVSTIVLLDLMKSATACAAPSPSLQCRKPTSSRTPPDRHAVTCIHMPPSVTSTAFHILQYSQLTPSGFSTSEPHCTCQVACEQQTKRNGFFWTIPKWHLQLRRGLHINTGHLRHQIRCSQWTIVWDLHFASGTVL